MVCLSCTLKADEGIPGKQQIDMKMLALKRSMGFVEFWGNGDTRDAEISVRGVGKCGKV